MGRNIQALFNSLLDALDSPLDLDGLLLQVGGSIGLTFYPQGTELGPDQLLRQADQAMYQAKLKGTNSWHLFDLQRDERQRDQNVQLERIREGLVREEFELHYQPLVNLRTGETVAVEALVRWRHPERGLLAPDAFLPHIEQSDTGIDLGNWVLARALSQRTIWATQGLALKVCVNISPYHLQNPRFSDDLAALLAQHSELPPGALELEVLENSALSQLEQVAALVATWRARGVHFAIDDFGTGYSSLSYLKRLPVATLKVDRSFVGDIDTDPDDLPILEGVRSLGRAFRLATVAEGVETAEQAALLLQLGYELAQGYAIARPMVADAVPGWVTSWRPEPAWAKVSVLPASEYPLLYALVAAQGEAALLYEPHDHSGPEGPPPSRRHVEHCLQRREEWPGRTTYLTLLSNLRDCLDACYTTPKTAPSAKIWAGSGEHEACLDALTQALTACRDNL